MDIDRFAVMGPSPEEMAHPDLLDTEPFRIAGSLYYAGNLWTSCHVIDTGDGLMLLDVPPYMSLPGTLAAISKLGFRVTDIKKIVISHAHSDHFGSVAALKRYSGATVYLSRVDAEYMRQNPDCIESMNRNLGFGNSSFVPDVELEDGDIVTLGNTRMRCVLTPGHTPGTMSHFWDLEEGGKTYHVGIYGGAGYLLLSAFTLKRDRLPFTLREDFLRSVEKVWDEPVDIMLGNHPFHSDIYYKHVRYENGEKDAFIDPSEWHRFLTDMKQRYLAFAPNLDAEQPVPLKNGFADYYKALRG